MNYCNSINPIQFDLFLKISIPLIILTNIPNMLQVFSLLTEKVEKQKEILIDKIGSDGGVSIRPNQDQKLLLHYNFSKKLRWLLIWSFITVLIIIFYAIANQITKPFNSWIYDCTISVLTYIAFLPNIVSLFICIQIFYHWEKLINASSNVK